MKQKAERKLWQKFDVFSVIIYVLLAVIAFSMLFPFWNAVVLSFNEGRDAQMGGIYFWPRKFTLSNYEQVFHTPDIWRAFFVSILRTVLGTLTTLIVTPMFAYALSKPHLKFRKFYMGIMLVSMYFNGGMIPTYLVVKGLNLINNFWVYIVMWMFNAFYATIFLSFYRGLPASLFESAKIGGAGEGTIFLKIATPLSKPTMAAIGLFVAVNHWNAWQDNLLYMKNEAWNTLSFLFVKMIKAQESLEGLAAQTGVSELSKLSSVSSTTIQLATMMVAVIPIICVYPFVQKHFASGMMIGAIKG